MASVLRSEPMQAVDRWDMRNNPYLMEWQGLRGDELSASSFTARSTSVREFGFAIPCLPALELIRKWSPHGVIEIGAGGGYWASRLTLLGCRPVFAFDRSGVKKNWYGFKRQWHPVALQDHRIVRHFPGAERMTLFICWPTYEEAWAAEALRMFRGSVVAYVGEGPGGCTGDDQFHELLYEGWEEVAEYSIPQWGGMHDRLTIFTRKVAEGDRDAKADVRGL